MSDSDWRLRGQEAYLRGATLRWRAYQRYSLTWDHDHCEFCFDKFAETEQIPDSLHEGYASLDQYRWICRSCFDDFHQQFGWNVVQGEQSAPPS